MSKINSEELKKDLKDLDIAMIGFPVKGSLLYLPYGCKIRERLYNIGIKLLKDKGFEQIILSDYIDEDSVKKMDNITKISNNYYKIENTNLLMTAGHEVSFYTFARELLKDHSKNYKFPMQYFHFGSIYRAAKNTKYPFNMGERKSFLECYSLHKTTEEAYDAINVGVQWNREFIQEKLHLPCVEVERPLITNKKFSQKSIHTDVITPLGMTTITGMTYFHNDIFTKALNVKRRDNKDGRNYYVYSNHFGVSEHILFTYLLNAYENHGFKLFSFIAPIQVSILDLTDKEIRNKSQYMAIFDTLRINNIDFEIEECLPKEIHERIKSNNRKGIPITIIIADNKVDIEIKFVSCGEEIRVENRNVLDNINEYFEKNDRYIVNKFKDMQENMIVSCFNIEEITNAIDLGKVAKIYCENEDEKILKIEAGIRCGEILGFQKSNEEGLDIIDGKTTNSIAFVSKRS